MSYFPLIDNGKSAPTFQEEILSATALRRNEGGCRRRGVARMKPQPCIGALSPIRITKKDDMALLHLRQKQGTALQPPLDISHGRAKRAMEGMEYCAIDSIYCTPEKNCLRIIWRNSADTSMPMKKNIPLKCRKGDIQGISGDSPAMHLIRVEKN